jgi:hypothetical protein
MKKEEIVTEMHEYLMSTILVMKNIFTKEVQEAENYNHLVLNTLVGLTLRFGYSIFGDLTEVKAFINRVADKLEEIKKPQNNPTN